LGFAEVLRGHRHAARLTLEQLAQVSGSAPGLCRIWSADGAKGLVVYVSQPAVVAQLIKQAADATS